MKVSCEAHSPLTSRPENAADFSPNPLIASFSFVTLNYLHSPIKAASGFSVQSPKTSQINFQEYFHIFIISFESVISTANFHQKN